MRILHLIPHLSKGGAERQMAYLTPELVRRGHEAHVAFLSECDMKRTLEEEGVVFHQLTPFNNYDPSIIWQICRLIRKVRPDLLHSWIPQMDVLAGICARITETPWIFREPSSAKGYPGHWKNSLRLWSAKAARLIVANSAGGADYWQDKLPDKEKRIIPNGFPIDRIESVEPARREDFSVTGDEKLVLYAGRIWSGKNVDGLIYAMEGVFERTPAKLLLCGDGFLRGEMEDLVRRRGLTDRIRFLGIRPSEELWSLMKAADLFVFVSEFEGFPNVVLEAMACGVPMVASDIPAHREILSEEDARFVDPSRTAEIEEALLECLSDPDSAKERASRAKAKTGERSIETMVESYLSLYGEVLDRATR